MRKIYLFGAGGNLDTLSHLIPWNKVSAIIDSSKLKIGSIYNKKKILSTNILYEEKNSLIVITSRNYYWEIYEFLKNKFGFNWGQIIGIASWLEITNKSIDYSMDVMDYMALADVFRCMAFRGIESVLFYQDYFSWYGVLSDTDMRIIRWKKSCFSYVDCCTNELEFVNLYRKTGLALEKLKYDAVVFINADKVDYKTWINRMLKINHSRFIMINLLYSQYDNVVLYHNKLSRYGVCEVVGGYGCGWLLIFDREPSEKKAISYVVTHKKVSIPKELINYGYILIQAGAINADKFGYLRDDQGENISSLNQKINECTALYWIWKHTTEEVIGICHYRRYFLYQLGVEMISDNILRMEEAESYLKHYDIIVAQAASRFSENGMYELMKLNVHLEAVKCGLRCVRKFLEERQPDYIDAFDFVMHGVSMFPCNMFITSRKVLDKYCSWLFSFIIDAANNMDVQLYDDCSKRIIGYIAERMLTVWLMKQNFRIKELPIYVLKDEEYAL